MSTSNTFLTNNEYSVSGDYRRDLNYGLYGLAPFDYMTLTARRSVARAVSDDQLSREILKTVAQLLKDPLPKGASAIVPHLL
jgi:hypothetical protein